MTKEQINEYCEGCGHRHGAKCYGVMEKGRERPKELLREKGHCGIRCLAAVKETRESRIKRASWNMAEKLMGENRLSFKMAIWALKQSGHSREEVRRFIEEAGEDESRFR